MHVCVTWKDVCEGNSVTLWSHSCVLGSHFCHTYVCVFWHAADSPAAMLICGRGICVANRHVHRCRGFTLCRGTYVPCVGWVTLSIHQQLRRVSINACPHAAHVVVV
jgi:hypothetical protein